MSTSHEGNDNGVTLTPTDPQRRMPCPDCNSPIAMKFIFPSAGNNPCFELNAWRFQYCRYCGWQGDVARRKRLHIEKEPLAGWRINGHFYETFEKFLKEEGLC